MAKRTVSDTTPAPKYQQVFAALADDIRSGKYQAGQKLPSEATLVRTFGTSRITVGRALRELTRVGLVRRRAGSGTFVLESPAVSGSKLFGLLIPNLGESEIFAPICQGMAAAPQTGDHALLWGHTTVEAAGSLDEQALQLCRRFIERRVDGVFFAPVEGTPRMDDTNQEILKLIESARLPVVLLDRDILRFPGRSRHDLVGIDHRRAAYLATEHLLVRGCRQVIFVTIPGAAPTVAARIAGYREAMLAYDAPAGPYSVQRLESLAPERIRQALDDVPADGVVCLNDRLAGRLMRGLLSLGYLIPDDLRIVGIDDVEYATLLPVPLTTIHQPCRDIGAAAVEVMLERIGNPSRPVRDVLLDCWLVERESSGPSSIPQKKAPLH